MPTGRLPVHRRKRMRCRRCLCFNRMTDSHVLPVVIEFLAAIEAGDVSASAGTVIELRPSGRSDWESRPLVRAAKQCIQQRVDHFAPFSCRQRASRCFTSYDSVTAHADSYPAIALPWQPAVREITQTESSTDVTATGQRSLPRSAVRETFRFR